MKDVRCQGIMLGYILLLPQAINFDSYTDPTTILLSLEGCHQPQTVTRPLTLPSALAPPSTLLDICLWDTGQESWPVCTPRRTWSRGLVGEGVSVKSLAPNFLWALKHDL